MQDPKSIMTVPNNAIREPSTSSNQIPPPINEIPSTINQMQSAADQMQAASDKMEAATDQMKSVGDQAAKDQLQAAIDQMTSASDHFLSCSEKLLSAVMMQRYPGDPSVGGVVEEEPEHGDDIYLRGYGNLVGREESQMESDDGGVDKKEDERYRYVFASFYSSVSSTRLDGIE
jgi:hypothetical protein